MWRSAINIPAGGWDENIISNSQGESILMKNKPFCLKIIILI
jgi:hypothetical protein